MDHAPQILLLIPTTSYRTNAFMTAAHQLGLNVIVGSDQKQSLADLTPGSTLDLPFHNPEKAIAEIQKFAQKNALRRVIGVDEETVILAAKANESLLITDNSIDAVQVTQNKFQMRQCFAQNGLQSPEHWLFLVEDSVAELVKKVKYPCVIKPTFLAASQGVIRANSQEQLMIAFLQLKALLAEPDMLIKGRDKAKQVLIEQYIPGQEIAVEGILSHGKLKVLAVFDKPDPLEGPYFPETIYLTPSCLSEDFQEKIKDTIQQASKAIGLREGPIHAELRFNDTGIWPLEIAARSIGGLCSRILEFAGGCSLEELILCHLLGRDVRQAKQKEYASGVMMLNVSQQGQLVQVNGIEQAKRIPAIDDVVISIPPGEIVRPLPLGARYLGFIFAHATDRDEVEESLRKAAKCLEIKIS